MFLCTDYNLKLMQFFLTYFDNRNNFLIYSDKLLLINLLIETSG